MAILKEAFSKLLTIQELAAQRRGFGTIAKSASELYWLLENTEAQLAAVAAPPGGLPTIDFVVQYRCHAIQNKTCETSLFY